MPSVVLALVLAFCAAGFAPAAPLRVVVISDLNGSYGSVAYAPRVARAVRAIIALDPDLVISAGDMVAGQRRPLLAGRELRAMWRGFHATVGDPLAAAGIPLVVTPGNHDASAYAGFARERRIYDEEWSARRPGLDLIAGGNWPFHYAFDLGGVRFVSLDATTVGALDPAQQAWLGGAMAGAGPARIVFSHLPLWPVAEGRETEVIGDPALAARLRDLGVDLHLSGHHHAFYPGAADGVALVSVACLGSGPRALIGTDERSSHGIVLIDIAADGGIVVQGLAGPDFTHAVDVTRLPPRIVSPAATLTRLDLAGLAGVTAGFVPAAGR